MTRELWTQEEVAKMMAMLNQGLSRGQIAKRIGRSRSAVIRKASHVMNPNGRREPEPEFVNEPVKRDPCPRCGVRFDYGCKHSRLFGFDEMAA